MAAKKPPKSSSPGWEATDPRESALLARLMLDSVLPASMDDEMALALGTAYAHVAQADAINNLAQVLKEKQ